MKIGIIRCMQTEDYCPGTADFMAVKNRSGAFSGVTEELEILHTKGHAYRLSLPICREDEITHPERNWGKRQDF